jgi:sec-independent protein translocase protein TatC
MNKAADPNPPKDDDITEKKMPLLDHLIELRSRMLKSLIAFAIAFVICFHFAEPIFGFLVEPLARIMAQVGGSQRMIYTALTEAFLTYVKVGLFGALILSFPIFATQIWLFVAPGLYKNEKRAILPFLLASPVLFLAGCALVYYIIIPLAWTFLLGFQTTSAQTVLPVQLEAKVGEYLGLVMKLIFAFGLCFQLPVLLVLLVRVGILQSESLVSKRRYAIVVTFIMAAILTPPDAISQIALAVPILLLYEAAIIASRLVERARKRDAEAAAGAGGDFQGPEP